MNDIDEIRKLRQEIEEKQSRLERLEKENFDIYGIWKVSTEGDCEGRSTKDLGIHQGNIFDIVKNLRSQAFYTLDVERVGYYRPNQENENRKREHTVNFKVIDRESIKLYDVPDQLNKLQKHVPENHTLTKSNCYGSVKLEWTE